MNYKLPRYRQAHVERISFEPLSLCSMSERGRERENGRMDAFPDACIVNVITYCEQHTMKQDGVGTYHYYDGQDHIS